MTASSPPPEGAALDRENPWPGLESFDESAREYFHGRGGETEDLLRRVVDAPVTVLFGKSGLGKTSLLKAGLFPRLREKHFLPVHVRLDVRPSAPRLVDQLRDALDRTITEEHVDATDGIHQGTLWEYLHRADLELWSEQNQPLIPVLVLDQFEEVFTLGEGLQEEVERFKVDFGDLAENRIPKALESRLATDSAAAHSLDLRAMPYKLLLSLREDFLPHLEGWRSVVPSLGRVRMRLLPMRPAQAFAAVYDTAPHLMDEPVARRIVQVVAAAPSSAAADNAAATGAGAGGSSGEIEPALLSLFCRGLNERRKREGKPRFDDQLLEGAQEGIILDYYRSCVEGLPDRASKFIETELITAKGFRNSYAKDDAVPAYLAPEQLDRLINQRLLRLEERYGTVRIELTHDLLTKAVLEQRRQRELEEEKAALMRRAEEDRQALAARAREERRRFRAVAAAAIVCLAFAAVAAYQWRAAARASDYADYRRQQAEQATRRAEDAKLAAEVAQGAALKAKSDAEAARGEADTQKLFAEEAQQSAEQQTRIAKARELAATAVPMVNESFDRQGDLPVLLALRAVAATYPGGEVTREAEDALRRATGGEVTSLLFPGHSLDVRALAFSPDGAQLATCSYDDTVRVWSVVRGEELQRRDGGRCDHLAFGADGVRMGLVGPPNLLVRDISGRTLVNVQVARGFGMTNLWLSADGRRVAFTDRGALVVSDTTSSRKLLEIPVNTWSGPIALSADGTRLAYRGGSGDAVSGFKVADVDAGREVQAIAKVNGDSPVLSPHGDLLALEEAGVGVNICDIKAGSCRLLAFNETIDTMAFSPPDGRLLALSTSADRVALWDTASLEEAGEHIQGSAPVAFSPDGQRLAVGSGDSSARIWDIKSRKLVATLSGRTDSRLRAVAFTDGATRMASGSDDRKVRVWEPASGRVLSTMTSPGFIQRMVISPAGDRVAGGVPSGDWHVWQLASAPPASGVQLERADLSSIAFGANGTRLVGGTTVGQFDLVALKLFDAQSGRLLAAPFGNDGKTSQVFGRTLSVAVNEKQTRIAASGVSGALVIDAASGRELLRIPEHRWDTVFGGPNGGWIAAAGFKATDIWDVDARRKVNQHTIPGLGQGERVRRGGQLALSHDGRRVAIVNEDLRTVSVWDTVTGVRHPSLYRHTDNILAIAFTRDDKHLSVALEDWTVHRHPLAIDDLVALGRKRVTRSLTPEECKTYLGNAPCAAPSPAR